MMLIHLSHLEFTAFYGLNLILIGTVLGLILGFGTAALITFLTGGLALPVAALIGIAVGSSLGGGAISGSISIFATQQPGKIDIDIMNKADAIVNKSENKNI